MAQYKVPQDVEADDKLLGPFNFRQFVYLMIAGGLIALAVGLFQLFPLLAILPLPPVVLLVALALPLKKDQPMETYLAAMVNFYLKPRSRVWKTGQRESTIQITAPKKVESPRTRDITGEEATHRLSFLADIVDTEGYAIKGLSSNPMREDLVAEANATVDMFEGSRFDSLGATIQKDELERHAEVVKQMQETIDETENLISAPLRAEVNQAQPAAAAPASTTVSTANPAPTSPSAPTTAQAAPLNSPAASNTEPPLASVVVLPDSPSQSATDHAAPSSPESVKKASPKPVKPSIMELANNDVFSVATIAEQAKRVNRKEKGEIFISLH